MATKITDQHLFSVTMQRARADYVRQITDSSGDKPKWRGGDVDEVAKSAAIQVGLDYSNGEVDQEIVKAIRILADTTKRDGEGFDAIADAWDAYRLHI